MLIGIKGPKGHGKSAAASALVEDGFICRPFAKPLKQVVKIVYGLTDEEMEDTALKETPLSRYPFLTPRHILQYVGTEMFRNFIGDTWVRAFEREAAKELDEGYSIVVPDLRFPNEAEAIRSLGGMIIEVYDPRKPTPLDQHPSETLSKSIEADVLIRNDMALEDLYRSIRLTAGLYSGPSPYNAAGVKYNVK